MEDRDRIANHIELEDLARLAEGTPGRAETERLQDHLMVCRSCMAAYADAIRYRAAWLSMPRLFVPPPALAREGAAALSAEIGAAARSRPRNPALRHGAWVLAGAATVIVLAAWTIMLAGRSTPGRFPPAILAAVETASANGLVIPGGEGGAVRPTPAYRAGEPVAGPGVEDAIERLRSSYESGDRSTRTSSALSAGLLAAGHIDAARDYVEESLRGHPRDVCLLSISAVIAHRSNDLALAEHRLRRALEIRPRDRVAQLDLALVLEESGRAREAREILSGLAQGPPGSPLTARARRELGKPPRG